MYRQYPWTRLCDRGGCEEELAVVTNQPIKSRGFNIEAKFQYVEYLEVGMHVGSYFCRLSFTKPPHYLCYRDTSRCANAHPWLELMDWCCQYCLYKTGATADEAVCDAEKL
ncbi:hypothetical protein IOCL2690_000525600 [Leishmania lindenbergi]|uniref:Uncharacterized protein n=1 Tax=Leishmania lindenbergi TaxID=651832 RepID=A0AAW3A7R3_9TRYP